MAYSQVAECFAEYAIGTCFLLLRLYARLRMSGMRNLHFDDAFTILSIVSYHAILQLS